MLPNLFEIIDKNGKNIRLTIEQWKHLLKHLPDQQDIDKIKETPTTPTKITVYGLDEEVHYFYRFYKNRDSLAKYLRVIVKYLNGDGFVITAHFVEMIR